VTGLHIADGLELPLDAVTETFAILAKRGSGKTYTASVMVEEFLGAGLPVCVVDPLGVWWGLRSSADGKSAGQPVVIFGGDHADVPL
jgi:DNA helicase HerA-like ATPase